MTFIIDSIVDTLDELRNYTHEMTRNVDPTVRKAIAIALPIIALISSVYGSIPTTCAILAGSLVGNFLAPRLVNDKALGRVMLAVGGTMLATQILIPFAKIIAAAAVSGGLCFAGYQITKQ